jgi:mRNA-degrading endonuclease toxin of MazEF toxin-antitoxin module
MGRGSLVKRGLVVVVELPRTLTREQAGRRPCVVVSSEASVMNDSVALVGQLRSIDKSQVSKVGNPLSTSAMGDIDAAIKDLLGLDVE